MADRIDPPLKSSEYEFLVDCARYGPTDIEAKHAKALEKRGLVSYDFEGLGCTGRWRLSVKGRQAMHGYDDDRRR